MLDRPTYMATQSSKKKKSKKRKALPSGDGIQDQVKEAVAILRDLVDKNPGSSHELLSEHIETAPSSADGGGQQPHQGQEEDVEHQRDSELQISAQEQVKTGGKKSKKRHKKKASTSMNRSTGVPSSESTEEEKLFTFEEQIEWCIGQLELGLHRREATKAQKDSNEKNIGTLRSLKVPIPRKRQLMRSLFGDYRSKMMTTPLPEASTRAKGPCVSVVEREVAEDCGKFFKHKHSHTMLVNATEGVNGNSEKQEQFCFNFVINSS